MSDFPVVCKDAKTTFVLARRAERLARPLVDSVGGAWLLRIDATLGDGGPYRRWGVSVLAHYTDGAAKIPGPTTSAMPVMETHITDSTLLERAIARIAVIAEKQVEATAKAEGADHADD